MNLIEAIKSGRPFRRKAWTTFWVDNCGNENDEGGIVFWDCAGKRIPVSREDICSSDWEIQEPAVTITASQFWNAVAELSKEIGCIGIATYSWIGRDGTFTMSDLAKKLGLERP